MADRSTDDAATASSSGWQAGRHDKEIARRVIIALEDRRLLFGERHVEDELHCVESAIEIRGVLTDELRFGKPGISLEASLYAMRDAMRNFVDAAGPNARNFRFSNSGTRSRFNRALGMLRQRIGSQLAVVSRQYGLAIKPELARILPASEMTEDVPSASDNVG